MDATHSASPAPETPEARKARLMAAQAAVIAELNAGSAARYRAECLVRNTARVSVGGWNSDGNRSDTFGT